MLYHPGVLHRNSHFAGTSTHTTITKCWNWHSVIGLSHTILHSTTARLSTHVTLENSYSAYFYIDLVWYAVRISIDNLPLYRTLVVKGEKGNYENSNWSFSTIALQIQCNNTSNYLSCFCCLFSFLFCFVFIHFFLNIGTKVHSSLCAIQTWFWSIVYFGFRHVYLTSKLK